MFEQIAAAQPAMLTAPGLDAAGLPWRTPPPFWFRGRWLSPKPEFVPLFSPYFHFPHHHHRGIQA